MFPSCQVHPCYQVASPACSESKAARVATWSLKNVKMRDKQDEYHGEGDGKPIQGIFMDIL